MSRRHADNWSHPGHYLVDPYTWYLGQQMVTVMVMNDLLPPPLCNANRPSNSEIKLFQNLTIKIHGQGHVCGQRSRSHLTFKFKRSRSWSRSNPLIIFEARSSIDMLAFRFVAIGPFLAEVQNIPYLTLTIKCQGHVENRQKSNQVIYRSGPKIVPKMKEIQNVVQKLSREQGSAGGDAGGGVRTCTKT